MKKGLLSCLCILIVFSVSAQINIGAPGAIKPSGFKKSDMEEFHTATTYFVLRESDKEQQSKIETLIRDVWKFNKFEVIDFDRYKSIANKENSIFLGLRSYNSSRDYVSNADLFGKYAQFTEVYIQLWRNLEVKKENHLEEQVLARIEVNLPWANYDDLKQRISIDAFEFLCKGTVKIPEWNWGLLKNYLQEINRCLIDNKPRWRFASDVDKTQIKNLQHETLFVEDRIMKRLDAREKETPFENYSGKHIEISMADLGNKILESEATFYYMIVYLQGSDKMTTVVNSKTGEFIYSDYRGQSNFFKPKDIKALVEKIEK